MLQLGYFSTLFMVLSLLQEFAQTAHIKQLRLSLSRMQLPCCWFLFGKTSLFQIKAKLTLRSTGTLANARAR